MSALNYKQLLLDQYDALVGLDKSARRLLVWALRVTIVMMMGCGLVTLLWIWFGVEARCLPDTINSGTGNAEINVRSADRIAP